MTNKRVVTYAALWIAAWIVAAFMLVSPVLK